MEKSENTQPSLDEMFQNLEDVVQALEQEMPLEDSFELYKKGMQLAAECSSRIDMIEKEITILEDENKEDEF